MRLKKHTGNLIRIFVLSVCATLFAGNAFGQSQTVTLSSREISVRDALQQIEAQTGYRFALGHSNFDTSRTVTLTSARGTVRNILTELLRGSNRTFRMGSENQILIVPVRMVPAEEKEMPVVRFDWSQSYGDDDFMRDMEEDRRRENLLRGELSGGSRESKVEITLVPDSVFHYGRSSISHDFGVNAGWKPLGGKAGNHIAVKTNILYGALALAPNLSAETGVGPKTSFELAYGLNLWNRYNDDNRKKIHWYVRPEFRYWTCSRFDGHFFGIHAFYWQYNVSRYNVPGMFDKEFQYEGNAFGAGITYGYHLPLAERWGVEFSLGLGVAFMKYDKYECARCGDFTGNFNKTYFGPTGLSVKLVYLIK